MVRDHDADHIRGMSTREWREAFSGSGARFTSPKKYDAYVLGFRNMVRFLEVLLEAWSITRHRKKPDPARQSIRILVGFPLIGAGRHVIRGQFSGGMARGRL